MVPCTYIKEFTAENVLDVFLNKDFSWSSGEVQESLRENNIFYSGYSTSPVWLASKDKLYIGLEDDGHIWFKKNTAHTTGYIPYLIADLKAAQVRLDAGLAIKKDILLEEGEEEE